MPSNIQWRINLLYGTQLAEVRPTIFLTTVDHAKQGAVSETVAKQQGANDE